MYDIYELYTMLQVQSGYAQRNPSSTWMSLARGLKLISPFLAGSQSDKDWKGLYE